MTTPGAPAAPAPRPRLSIPRRRSLALSAGLCALSLVLWALRIDHVVPAISDVTIPWWGLAIGFALTELLVFHIEVDHEAHTFTLSEVPIVVGLFFASPEGLVAGRVVGEAFTLILRNRQPPSKLVFNLSMFTAECVTALAVFAALSGGASLASPRAWAAALAAAAAADLLSIASVALVIRWHGGAPEPGALLVTGGITAVANTSIALTGAILLSTNVAAVLMVAVIAVVAWVSYRGYTSLSQRYANLEQLYEFTTVVGGTRSAESVVEALLGQARDVLRAESAELILFAGEPDAPCMRLTARAEARLVSESVPLPFDPAEPVWRKVIADRRPVLVPRDSKDPDLRAAAHALGVKDCILVPLAGSQGVTGTLKVSDRLGEISTFDAEDVRLFETLANHAAVALENGRLIDRLGQEATERAHQAFHDDLTGLPNRKLLYRTLHEAGDALEGVVMIMDLDGFKDVNDTLGHHTGDVLLQEVARRLRDSVPEGSLAARLGGDEFSVYVPGPATPAEAVAHAHRIQERLRQPIDLLEVIIEPKGSIGIALAPRDGREASALLKSADVAMYAAKRGGTGVEVYEPDHDADNPRQLALSSRLRAAIAEGEVFVHFQPKARLHDGSVIGTEALARWRHPEFGMVPPDEFVSIAERRGLMGLLTEAVLDAAIRQCRVWMDGGYEVGVAVNLAVRSLLDPDFPATVGTLLARHGVPAAMLTLEITETSIMAKPDRAVATLDQLAALGVQLSIDDFGTGYSSLSYLQRLPVHEVKIDRSFVQGMAQNSGDAAIVASIVGLSRTLGMRVVAEGVEDAEGWNVLKAIGCYGAQGFYLSRPVDGESLTRWLAAHVPRAQGATGPSRPSVPSSPR